MFVKNGGVDFGQANFCHPLLDNQLSYPLFVALGPLRVISTRRELLGVFFVVDPLDDAVDPAETECLFDGIVVGNSRLCALLLVVHQPDFGLRRMMLWEPLSPLVAIL